MNTTTNTRGVSEAMVDRLGDYLVRELAVYLSRKSLRAALEAALSAEPAAQGDAVAYFSADPAEGWFDMHKTLSEAVAGAEAMLESAQDDASDYGWQDEPPQICYGVVLGGCVEKEGSRRPAPEGSEFTALVDYRLTAPPAQPAAPIPMLLLCPKCHTQHIDAPDERTPDWNNPPHKSHLCHACGCIWRPADVPTTGVERIETRGKADTFDPAEPAAQGEAVAWQIETDDDVERVAKAAGWDNRRYMTPTDYAIWCNRMRDFVRIAVDVPQPFAPPAQPAELTTDAQKIQWRIAYLEHGQWSKLPDGLYRVKHESPGTTVLTRAEEPAERVPEGVLGYFSRDDAEKLLKRKGEECINFSHIEVWNRQSEFYPVALTASPAPSEGGKEGCGE